MTPPRQVSLPQVPGLACRRIACDILGGVLRRRRPLDEQLDGQEAHPGFSALSERDRALVRKLTATALRRLGSLRAVLSRVLERGLPENAPGLEPVLLIGATQILWLDVADHAAVDLAVRLVQADRRTGVYAGLVNAVLRRITRESAALLAELDPIRLDTPPWLRDRWVRQFGEATARAIAAMHACEPPLDLSARRDASIWATRLGGVVITTGTVRTLAHGRISELPGYAEGAWWVQDAAASLPVRLFGDLANRQVADLCAAPGGKTAQLAVAGAAVTAVDRSMTRLARLRANLTLPERKPRTRIHNRQSGAFSFHQTRAATRATGREISSVAGRICCRERSSTRTVRGAARPQSADRDRSDGASNCVRSRSYRFAGSDRGRSRAA